MVGHKNKEQRAQVLTEVIPASGRAGDPVRIGTLCLNSRQRANRERVLVPCFGNRSQDWVYGYPVE